MPLPVVKNARIWFKDGAGYTTALAFHLNPDADESDLQVLIGRIAYDADLITDAQIVGCEVYYNIDIPIGVKGDPTPQCDIEAGAQFSFKDEVGNYARLVLPALNLEYVLPDSKLIDQDAVDVATFLSDFLAGNYTAHTTTNANTPLVALDTAKQHFVQNRKAHYV